MRLNNKKFLLTGVNLEKRRSLSHATAWLRLRTAGAARLLPMLLLLLLPAMVQAQFNFTTNNGTITITGYTGSSGAVAIPSIINGLAVTSIGDGAFWASTNLTSFTIPNRVTGIGFCEPSS